MTISYVLKRIAITWSIVFCLPVTALLINLYPHPYAHNLASVLAGVWFYGGVMICFMKRPPCYYGGYGDWWADRANWWRKRS